MEEEEEEELMYTVYIPLRAETIKFCHIQSAQK